MSNRDKVAEWLAFLQEDGGYKDMPDPEWLAYQLHRRGYLARELREGVKEWRITKGETQPYIWCVYHGNVPLKRFLTIDDALAYLRKLFVLGKENQEGGTNDRREPRHPSTDRRGV